MKRQRIQHWRQALTQWRGATPKSKALMQLIARDIESGELVDGQRLPAQREVSEGTGLSLQTVTNAYRDLERHGLIRCEVGRGSYVSPRSSERVASYVLDRNDSELVDLSTARIAFTQAHQQAWQALCATWANSPEAPWLRDNRPIAGLESHRQAGLTWLHSLGVETQLDRVLITGGAAQGVFIALAAVASADDVVLTERLTDHGVIGACNVLGLDLRGVDSDEHGMRPDHFEDLCASERVSALVLTPNFNNPTATLLSESRRRSIARIAQQYGVYIIEDDAYGALLSPRLLPVSAHAPEHSFYVTGFAKSVLTGLRIGYLSVPRRMALRADSLLRVSTWMAPPLLAEAATQWVVDGTAQQLVGVQRAVLAHRHALLRQHMGPHLLGHHPQALIAWLAAPRAWRLETLAQSLRQRHVAVTLPEPFMTPGTSRPHALRISLGADCSDEQFEQGLRTLAEVFDQVPPLLG